MYHRILEGGFVEQSSQTKLMSLIVASLDAGSDPMAARTMSQPTGVYVSAEHLSYERTHIFNQVPLVVGLADQVRSPGDFFVDDLTGKSLLIVRDESGELRGFHNVCGHRGARVQQGGQGCTRRFTCPYHAWTYDTAGVLVSIPNDDGFADLDRSTRGLVEFPVESRHGLIWANPEALPEHGIDVAMFLGDLDRELSEFEIDTYAENRSELFRESFNWKQVIDGFLETYHLRFLHRTTVSPFIRSNFALFDDYGVHGRMVALRTSFDSMRSERADEFDLLPHIAIIYQIFPNTILVWQGDHFEVWSSYPSSDASTMVARASLLTPPSEQAPRQEH
ncbi:MAG: hypothetical protein DRJ50_08290, partial [Actinobacteria bacterium]